MNVIKLIQQGEGVKTEFKTSFQKEVIETEAAFVMSTALNVSWA